MDNVSRTVRSRTMASVRSRCNKSTEIRLVSILRKAHFVGWRRRNSRLPGRPDFVFPKTKLAIFVDGCFWHGCPRCYRQPSSNVAYWRSKIDRNRKRDLAVTRALCKLGWKVLRIWECQLKDAIRIVRRIRRGLQ